MVYSSYTHYYLKLVYRQKMKTTITCRRTHSSDFDQCVEVRSKTRQNPISAIQLAEYGISAETQGPLFDDGT